MRARALSLGGARWRLKGYWPWVPLQGGGPENGADPLGVTEWIEATVPGGVVYDLWRAGLVPHPYVDAQSAACEWVEHRWWVYAVDVDVPPELRDGRTRVELAFESLDHHAIVFVGRTRVGEHEGALVPARFDVTSALAGAERVEIKVVLTCRPDEMGQTGKTSLTRTQKPRFNYKWDFSTRLVSVGVAGDVTLRALPAARWDDVRVATDLRGDGVGVVTLDAEAIVDVAGVTARCIVARDGRSWTASCALDDTGRARFDVEIPGAEPWWPNGYGAQPLYDLRLELLARDAALLDEHAARVGVRRLATTANPGAPPDALPYTFTVNGRPIFARGMNVTPLDHLPGTVTDAQTRWLVELVHAAHGNMVRVWGGGGLGSRALYEACDELGVLVWQDFLMSSSLLENAPPRDETFLAELERAAAAMVRARRSHTSLAVWCGGNELSNADGAPCGFDEPTLAALRRLVGELDPGRPMLPTTGSGPIALASDAAEGHDVHGDWYHLGNGKHHAFYERARYLFHAEFGVPGASSARTIAKFASAAHRRPAGKRDDAVWAHHGEWWDTFARDVEAFGPFGDDLDAFAECSQLLQAEGLRYVVERDRRRAPYTSGSLVWQLDEPWPNAWCTSLVEYYGDTKLAYALAGAAFAPRHVSLSYARIDCGDELRGELFVHDDACANGEEHTVTAVAFDIAGRELARGEWRVTGDGAPVLRAGEMAWPLPPGDGLVILRVTLGAAPPAERGNVYLFSRGAERPYAPVRDLAPELAVEAESESESEHELEHERPAGRRAFRVENRGPHAALFVRPRDASDAFWLRADVCPTLLPGESARVEVTFRRKAGGGFLAAEAERARGVARPDVRFRAIAAPEVNVGRRSRPPP